MQSDEEREVGKGWRVWELRDKRGKRERGEIEAKARPGMEGTGLGWREKRRSGGFVARECEVGKERN